MSSPAADPREARLRALVEALGKTPAGRALGVARLRTFADLRASLPLLDAEAHHRHVESQLGFAEADGQAMQLGLELERERVTRAWRSALGEVWPPHRVALLRASHESERLDAARRADFESLAEGEVEFQRIVVGSADALVEALDAFEPDGIVCSSLAICAALERAQRRSLHRLFPDLRAIWAEYDVGTRLRTRLLRLHAGWVQRGGRLGVPAGRPGARQLVLATASTLIELLPHADPVVEARVGSTEATVLPEHAIMGERYELVVSSPAGELRRRTGEYVQVIGFEGADGGPHTGPRPRVVRLAPPPPSLRLEGVTLAGAHLSAAVRQAFAPEDPALVGARVWAEAPGESRTKAGSSTSEYFEDTELGSSRAIMRRAGGRPRALRVSLEVQGGMLARQLAVFCERVDTDLRRRSPAYDYLRGQGELEAVRADLVPAGTSARQRSERLEAFDGSVERPVVRVGA